MRIGKHDRKRVKLNYLCQFGSTLNSLKWSTDLFDDLDTIYFIMVHAQKSYTLCYLAKQASRTIGSRSLTESINAGYIFQLIIFHNFTVIFKYRSFIIVLYKYAGYHSDSPDILDPWVWANNPISINAMANVIYFDFGILSYCIFIKLLK